MGIYLKQYFNDKPPLGSQLNFGHPLSRDMVGCWLMNEGGGISVRDIVQNHNGTISGALWAETKQGVGLSFDGDNDYVLVNDFLAVPTNQFLSVSAWVYFNTATNDDYIIDYGDSATNGFLFLRDDVDSVSGRTDCFTVLVTTPTTGYRVSSATNSAVAGRWYNVVFTFDSSADTIRLFINGIEDVNSPNTAGAGNMILPTVNCLFGATSTGSSTANCNGKISNIMMWSRALSPSEIRSLYEAPYQMVQTPKNRIYSYLAEPGVITAQPRSYGYVF